MLIGKEMRDPDSKSTVKARRTPQRSLESAPPGGSGLEASLRGSSAAWDATLGRMDDREEVGWIDGQELEDPPERLLQSVHGGAAQSVPPAVIDERREREPDLLAPGGRHS